MSEVCCERCGRMRPGYGSDNPCRGTSDGGCSPEPPDCASCAAKDQRIAELEADSKHALSLRDQLERERHDHTLTIERLRTAEGRAESNYGSWQAAFDAANLLRAQVASLERQVRTDDTKIRDLYAAHDEKERDRDAAQGRVKRLEDAARDAAGRLDAMGSGWLADRLRRALDEAAAPPAAVPMESSCTICGDRGWLFRTAPGPNGDETEPCFRCKGAVTTEPTTMRERLGEPTGACDTCGRPFWGLDACGLVCGSARQNGRPCRGVFRVQAPEAGKP